MNNIVKLIIIGALIVAIPVTVKLVQQQQILKSKAAGNGIPVSDNPPNAKRPCDNAYTWKVLPPGTNGAPALDATRFGMGNDGQGNGCSQHSDCPKNTSDPQNVDQNTSNWCYEFGVGNRCIQLQHIPGQTCAGGGGGGGGGGSGTCSIGGQSPDIGATCAACLSSKTSPTNVPQVITNIKNMNPNDFSACSNQKILNNWCNGFGETAAKQCNELKTGVCAISCGGLPPPPITPVRRDLCVSTAVSSGTVPAGGQLTITSTSNEANLRNFRYAFFNRDNGSPPKIICQQGITSVVDAAETARQCPNGGAPLVIDKPAAASATSLPTTFSSADLSKPDTNWNNQIPTHFQVNGYFIDQFGLSSTANINCSKPFDITVSAPPPSPTPSAPPVPSNRMPGDADDNRCVNVDDYTIWKQEAGVGGTKSCANWTSENPSMVDTEDYGIWYRAWKVLTNRQGCITPPAGSRCIDK